MTYTKEVIQENIRTDVRWVIRTLEVLFNRQTSEEQTTLQTHNLNGRGFNGMDSNILSSFHLQVQKRKLQNHPQLLSEKQLDICRKKLPKYWKQVLEEIEQRQG